MPGVIPRSFPPYLDLFYFDLTRDGPPWQRLVEKPTTLTQCLPFTALVWDTAVTTGMATKVGNVVGMSVDDSRIWRGAYTPQFRYYSANDPFSAFLPGTYGNNRPVLFTEWSNIDPPPVDTFGWGFEGMAGFPFNGNIRFRHNKNTTCNVGFADGHVGQFTGKFNKDGRPIRYDALRKYFMVKWPSGIGIGPDPTLPH